ncbi:MAG: restriction endonuclease subunit S [Candidatus Thermoplasmatota archaeon]|nr:restriction endonuclease subunit S [Candidatus Thermoplasmatota archaeon]
MKRVKQTELGELPEEWGVVNILKTLAEKKFKVGKIKQLDYKKIGKIPVVDQGNNHIAGYSDDEEKAYKGDLPVVIFGDHTRIIKYIDFPFIIGADGVKILLPNRDMFHPKFFYYTLLNLQIESRGYNRHFSILKEKVIPLPPLPEQRKIASILSTADETIQKTNELIEKTQELKKGLMQQLLTKGIGHKKFKKTEIGEIPEEWDVVRLWEVIESTQLGTNGLGSESNEGLPLLKMGNLTKGGFNFDKLEYAKEYDTNLYQDYLLRNGDFLFNTRNTIELVGKTAVWKNQIKNAIFNNNIMRIKFKSNLIDNATWLCFYFNSKEGWRNLKRIVKGTTSVAAIYWKDLKKVKTPLPPLPEQRKIASILSNVDEKIEVERKRKEKLEELKKGLMQVLLTGKVRVKVS